MSEDEDVKNVARFALVAVVLYVVGGILLRTLSLLVGFISFAVAGIVMFALGYMVGRSRNLPE
jgi:hypothetical protein